MLSTGYYVNINDTPMPNINENTHAKVRFQYSPLSNNSSILIILSKQPSLVLSFVKKSLLYTDTAIFPSLKSPRATFLFLTKFVG